jgi:two-component system nitrate/nitrite response regulator NarP
MTRLLLADDHPFILAGLEAILRDTEFKVVATLQDGDEVLERLPSLRPDIVVLDVNMPRQTGIDVLRAMRSRGDRRPVVLLTASLSDARLLEALQLGVQGIVLKDGAQNQLLDCLKAVRQGEKWIERSLMQRALDVTVQGSDPAPSLSKLTSRERLLVSLIGKGLRNRDIAKEMSITEGTVKVSLHRIYEKLGVGNRTELALLAADERRGSNQ